jgi:hypothetical protein
MESPEKAESGDSMNPRDTLSPYHPHLGTKARNSLDRMIGQKGCAVNPRKAFRRCCKKRNSAKSQR